MRTYRVLWLALCGLLGIVGAGVAFVWSVPATLVIFGCAAVASGAMTGRLFAEGGARPPLRDLVRLVSTDGFLGGTAAIAVVGLVALLGAWALAVLVLVAGSSPYVLRVCRRRLRLTRSSAPPGGDQAGGEIPIQFDTESTLTAPAEPRSMNDTDLCRAWQTSFIALQRAPSLSHQLGVIEARQNYLDELERRNPQGLTAWLASGARAAGDPSRFVLGSSGAHCPPIDWDGLIHGPDR